MATIAASITIEQDLLNQVAALAQQMNFTQNEVFAMAMERFIRQHQPASDDNRVINQGDLYWLRVSDTDSDIAHPHVVIQDNLLNHSRIHTVVVCALTSNIKRITMPGNVLLDDGEAHLTRQSVVEISKLSTIEKLLVLTLLVEILVLARSRYQQVLQPAVSIQFLVELMKR